MNRRRRGAHLIETALVLVPFVFTLVGILDMGQFLFFYQTYRERVRAAARYAVVNPYDTQAITNVVLYNSPTTPPGGTALFGLTPSMVTVTRYDQGTSNDRIEVAIANPPVVFFSPLLAGYQLHPVFRAVMPVESLGATD